ncbi:MAG TPA: glycosyltransferase family 4 protein, partial [Burkholderiales bacterium]|nr:glycosyltransferase family 4 protein [Burkholderiales bacterium]
ALEWKKSSWSASRKDFSIPEDKFVFFYAADIGSIMERKNPMAMVHAYIQEFKPEEGACCVIKINYANRGSGEIKEILSIAKQRPDVIFMDKLLEEYRMRALFEQIDCYVSPHRSEGLGLTILEAMSACKPVVATPYGGVTDFVTEETAFPIEFQMTRVGEGNFPYPSEYTWADPSVDSLRKMMRHVFLNRAEAHAIARRGKALAGRLFSLEQTSSGIRKEISRIWNVKINQDIAK